MKKDEIEKLNEENYARYKEEFDKYSAKYREIVGMFRSMIDMVAASGTTTDEQTKGLHDSFNWILDHVRPPEYERIPEPFRRVKDVFRLALEQAQYGKGLHRHGEPRTSFMDQPIMHITKAVGIGFPLGQAMKKCQEAARMRYPRGRDEILGAMIYLVAAYEGIQMLANGEYMPPREEDERDKRIEALEKRLAELEAKAPAADDDDKEE